MKVIALALGMMEENCYIVASDSGNATVIDPGGEADRILGYAEKNGLRIEKILLTHGHFDHVLAVKEIKDATDATIYIHELDQKMLESAEENLGLLFGIAYQPVSADVLLSDGDTVTMDELTFRVLHTPGHTPGSVCYLTEGTIFSGDTLFSGSIGRTDFPNGNSAQMNGSLQKLIALSGGYTVLSGHGEKTTLEWERKNNPYIRLKKGEF